MRGIRLPVGTWAALVFLLVSAWLWAAHGPGSSAIHQLNELQAKAQWAGWAALVFSIWALGLAKNTAGCTTAGCTTAGCTVLLMAAACLAIARSPLPRKAVSGESRPVQLQARLVRWTGKANGHSWGLLDCVQSTSGQDLSAPAKRYFFTTASGNLNFSPGSHLHLRGLLVATPQGHQLRKCLVRGLPSNTPLTVLTQFREWARNQLHRNLPPPHRELASALLLGERGGMDPFQLASYRQLGLLHLLAISGMHFWVWSAALRRLLPTTWKSARPPALFLIAALADFSAPVIRALTAILLRDWLSARGRGIAAHHLWAMALWVEVALLPYQPTGLGLILTYLATGSLILGQPPAKARPLRKVMQPSTCAFLGTMPTLHALQGTLEPWSIPLTPVLGTLMPLRLFSSASALAPGFAPGSLWMFEQLQAWEDRFLQRANQLPGTPWAGLHYDNLILSIGCGLALLAFAKTLVLTRIQQLVLLAPLAITLCFPARSHPSLIVLPVGHGLASAITGQEKTLLFDLGSGDLSPNSLVDRIWMPTMNRVQAASETCLVLSHTDQDHTNGVAALKERLNFDYLSCEPGQMKEVADMHPFRVLLIGCPAAGDASSNEGGHALDVRGPAGRFVLLGDQFGYGLRALCEMLAPGPIEGLLLPHHGLTTDGLPELLDHLLPNEVWASCGQMDLPLPVSPMLQDRGLLLRTTLAGALLWSAND